MIEQAAAKGRRIGLLSTFPPTLASMPHGGCGAACCGRVRAAGADDAGLLGVEAERVLRLSKTSRALKPQ
jgi:hypothetical protein